jgi:type I restriction enzyme S subunit
VLVENESFRFDSEYFKKEYLENKINYITSLPLYKLASLSDGDHSKFPDNQNQDVRYLQARDISSNFIEIISNSYVSQEYFKRNQRSAISANTILMSIMGNIGDLAITPDNFLNCMCNRALAIIKNITGILPQFLFTYLMTSHLYSIIKRASNGGVQKRLNIDILKNLPIPIFSPKIQQLIEKIVIAAHTKRNLSKSLYTEAEQLLLQELGLVNFKPSTENIAIKKLSESFGTTGRLDADYYQPKYEEIENVISKYRLGYNAIGSVFKLSKQNFKVDKDKLYEYVEIGSINVSSGEIVPELITGAELPSNAKRKLKVGQVIVSKVRTYRSGIAIIDKDNYVGSTAFSILEEKPNGKVNKETLFSFLRSNLFLEWSLKPNTGTSYPVILDEDILNFNIPLIDTNIQNIIASKIQQSFALRKESKHLLDIAKQAVEMAIEEDEETAIKWLNEVTIPETNIHEKS